MFGWVGKMLGSEKAMEKTVESVSRGLDALVYTDEERENDAAANRSEARKMVVEWMQTTQGQNLSRRVLALSITGVWLMQYLLGQLFSFVSIWVDAPEKWMSSSALAQNGAAAMNSAVMLILAFYFAAPHMGDIVNTLMSRMGKEGVITKG